jgi:lipoyl-dependent peroxiredoxin
LGAGHDAARLLVLDPWMEGRALSDAWPVGKAGHGRTSDGRLDLQLSVPEEMGGQGGPGTNPEQLFAVGYGACFQSALLGVARGRKLDAGDSTVTPGSGSAPPGTVALAFGWPWTCMPLPVAGRGRGPDGPRAPALPYSNATWGNIQVVLSFDGTPIQRAAA